MGQKKLYTLDEAATYLNVSKRTILRYIKRGYIVAHKPRPRYTRIKQSELDRFKEVYK